MHTPYGAFGPGGGSLPAWVMRSGMTAPFNPMNPRRDMSPSDVIATTTVPVGMDPAQSMVPDTTTPTPAPVAGAYPYYAQYPYAVRGRRRRRYHRYPRFRGLPGALPGGIHGAFPPPMDGAFPPAWWTGLSTAKKVAVGAGAAVVTGLAIVGIVKLI